MEGVQLASGVEYVKPDLGLVYAQLAPKVVEAWAFFKCGRLEEAREALERCKATIDEVATTAAVFEYPQIRV
jgi:hypothetical protein